MIWRFKRRGKTDSGGPGPVEVMQPGVGIDLEGLDSSQVMDMVADAVFLHYERLFSPEPEGANVPSAISLN